MSRDVKVSDVSLRVLSRLLLCAPVSDLASVKWLLEEETVGLCIYLGTDPPKLCCNVSLPQTRRSCVLVVARRWLT